MLRIGRLVIGMLVAVFFLGFAGRAEGQGNRRPADPRDTVSVGGGGVTTQAVGGGGGGGPSGSPVSVTPDGVAAPSRPTNTSGYSEVFTITNTGTQSDTYLITCAGGGGVTCTGTSNFKVTLFAGAQTNITASYDVGAIGTGTLSLTATSMGNSELYEDAGSYSVVITGPQGAPTVALHNQNDESIDRSLCLTINGGEAAQLSCGNLMVYHSMPVYRTFGRDRSLSLVYNSITAEPRPTVAAWITMPATISQPDSVETILKVSGITRSRVAFSGWGPGLSRQVVVGFDASIYTTGVYPFTLETKNYYDGTPYSATTQSGNLLIVNREASPFGAGWSIAGLEELKILGGTSPLIWTGGDGSIRRYANVNSTTWVAPAGGVRDTINLAGGVYTRRLANGTLVKFNGVGQHISTVNAAGKATTFSWVSGRLNSIAVPSPTGAKTYWFTYVGGVLDKIMDPASRVLDATVTGARLVQLKDPDNALTTFGYSSAGLLTTRTNSLNATATYDYTWALFVYRFHTPLTASTYATTNVTSWNQHGLTLGSPTTLRFSTATSAVRTMVNGPRTDVSDVTSFWIDSFGSPIRIQDALGNDTYITRGNPAFPALPTRLEAPNGLITASVYDAQGRLISVTDSSTLATTSYEWGTRLGGLYSKLVRVTNPVGDFVRYGINENTGDVMWQEDNRGVTSRVNYAYNVDRLLREVVGPTDDTTRFWYDWLGNLTNTTSPMGFVSRVINNSAGLPDSIWNPIDSAQTAFSYTRVFRDAMGRDTLNLSWAQAAPYMDQFGNTKYASGDDTLRVTTSYDLVGNILSVKREARPDRNNVGPVITSYVYDAANRRVATVAGDSKRDSTVYDPAGNVIRSITRHAGPGLATVMTYDAMNRLTQRSVPAMNYPLQNVTIEDSTWAFPRFPNNGTGYQVAAEVSNFQYDVMGNLTVADNNNAHVRRGYNLNGSLAWDTLRIRTYNGSDFNQHVYGLQYAYDLNGRRKVMRFPSNLVADSTIYSYQSATGLLETVRSPYGDLFRYGYDLNGRLESLTRPGGIVETRGYDRDGRMDTRTVTASVVGGMGGWPAAVVESDLISRDATGRVMHVDDATGEQWMGYHGLGMMVWSDVIRDGIQGTYSHEFYGVDALGNRVNLSSDGRVSPEDLTAIHKAANYSYYADSTGRMLEQRDVSADGRRITQYYDASGNQDEVDESEVMLNGGKVYAYTRKYYAADGRLAVVDKQSCAWYTDVVMGWSCNGSSTLPGRGDLATFEEHRYDALGRRVLTRNRSWISCVGPNCDDVIQRTVWDGNQILAELRYQGHEGAPDSVLERDVGVVDLSGGYWQPLECETQIIRDPECVFIPIPAAVFPFGQVIYTHGAGLDAPLAVQRRFYSGGNIDQTVIPITNWRGDVTASADEIGRQLDCTLTSTWSGCLTVEWPGERWWWSYQFRKLPDGGPTSWMGSLMNNKRDPSGQLYMRNRFYDPETGRFTQEDPIGIAGGLNLYGFAGGDPVNFSDPFGLCPEPPCRSPDDPMKGRPLPPDVNPDDVTWNPEEGWYEHDTDGTIYQPHPEDVGHWDHWDVRQPGQAPQRYPENSLKPWPGQRRPPRGSQSPVDPWPAPPGRLDRVVDGIRDFLDDILRGLENIPPPHPGMLPPLPLPVPVIVP